MSIKAGDLELLSGASQESKDIVLGAPVRHFKDRDILLHDQGAAKAVYVLLEGQVRIERRGTKVAHRAAGELIGEQAFIDRKPHSADIIADGDVRAIELIGERMEQLLLDPVLARTLMSIVSCKLREATSDRYRRYAESEKLFAAFGQFVDPHYRDDMLEKGDIFGSPTVRNVIILFTDARNFTATAATMDPLTLGDELGAYVGTIGDILRAHGAFVDKYIGDGVMAFWGYPGMPVPNADVTFAAAKQILAATTRLQLGGKSVHTGIGINTGEVFMGNIGSDERRQFTVVGDAVNLAARFENMNKEFDADIVCAEAFFESLAATDRADFEHHPDSVIRGAAHPLDLYSYKGRT